MDDLIFYGIVLAISFVTLIILILNCVNFSKSKKIETKILLWSNAIICVLVGGIFIWSLTLVILMSIKKSYLGSFENRKSDVSGKNLTSRESIDYYETCFTNFKGGRDCYGNQRTPEEIKKLMKELFGNKSIAEITKYLGM